jgi:peptide/nickel transport system substrate-binding protein
MRGLTRREYLAGAATTGAILAARPSALAKPQPKRGGVLRFVPHADLKILDPIWTTAYLTRNHGYLIYDTLFATDERYQVRPQMVDRWTVSADGMTWAFTLREGLRWHDGQPVTAGDCVASIQRWGKRDALGRLLMEATGTLQATNERAFVLELRQPFGLVLEALGKPSSNVPFMMPARLAQLPDSEQVTEPIGSGPYRFVPKEWRPGHQVVYERNSDYVPRDEAPSGTAGGKRVYLDRVVWRYLPDPATAAAALEAGEVDYWEAPPVDYAAHLEPKPNLALFVSDARTVQGWIRPNCLQPPFDHKAARQALLHLADQEVYLQAAVGKPKYYRACPSYYGCGTPYETAAGAVRADPERARALFKAAGYDGRAVVIFATADLPALHAAALVTADRLRHAGVTVDVQAMDYSTAVSRRAKKDAWHLFHLQWVVVDVMTPAVNAGLTGAGDTGLWGWHRSEEMARLRMDWVRTTDPAKRHRLAEQLQVLAYEEVPYVPWGQYISPSVHRKAVQGVVKAPATVFWNIWLDA